MKKLDDIPRTNIYEVPDGYFEGLPTIIQSRLSDQNQRNPSFRWALAGKFAIPALVIMTTAGIFWYQYEGSSNNPQKMIESVSSQNLISFLQESEISEEELLHSVDLDNSDVESLSTDSWNNLDASDLEKELEKEI